MKLLLAAIILSFVSFFAPSLALQQQSSCNPVSELINDIVIKFEPNFPGCNTYNNKSNYLKENQNHTLLYENNSSEMRIIVKEDLNNELYAINLKLRMLLIEDNYNPGDPRNIGINGCTGSIIKGCKNNMSKIKNETEEWKIALAFVPRDLGSEEYVCIIETTIDEEAFTSIAKSLKIEKILGENKL